VPVLMRAAPAWQKEGNSGHVPYGKVASWAFEDGENNNGPADPDPVARE